MHNNMSRVKSNLHNETLFFKVFFLCWTTLVISFNYYFTCYILTFFWQQVVDFIIPIFPLHLRTGFSTSDKLHLLVIAEILPKSVTQVLFKVRTIFAWCRENFSSKSTWLSRDLNRGPPGRCESGLPPDHGDLPTLINEIESKILSKTTIQVTIWKDKLLCLS